MREYLKEIKRVDSGIARSVNSGNADNLDKWIEHCVRLFYHGTSYFTNSDFDKNGQHLNTLANFLKSTYREISAIRNYSYFGKEEILARDQWKFDRHIELFFDLFISLHPKRRTKDNAVGASMSFPSLEFPARLDNSEAKFISNTFFDVFEIASKGTWDKYARLIDDDLVWEMVCSRKTDFFDLMESLIISGDGSVALPFLRKIGDDRHMFNLSIYCHEYMSNAILYGAYKAVEYFINDTEYFRDFHDIDPRIFEKLSRISSLSYPNALSIEKIRSLFDERELRKQLTQVIVAQENESGMVKKQKSLI